MGCASQKAAQATFPKYSQFILGLHKVCSCSSHKESGSMHGKLDGSLNRWIREKRLKMCLEGVRYLTNQVVFRGSADRWWLLDPCFHKRSDQQLSTQHALAEFNKMLRAKGLIFFQNSVFGLLHVSSTFCVRYIVESFARLLHTSTIRHLDSDL